MNTLVFDAGNTRLKWSLLSDGRFGAMQAAELGDLSTLQQWLTRNSRIERVIGVCVAGSTFERRLRSALHAADLPSPELMHSSGFAAGVSNGYREAQLLGDDRWAAAIAAWHRAGCYRTVCAVCVGTALTIDLVDQDGNHRGGLIAPGPQLMLSSLLGKTHGIAERAASKSGRATRSRTRPGTAKALADNTHDAIQTGCLATAAGLIDRTVNLINRELGVRPVVFVAGGDADRVRPLLKSASKPCPELVLRGVALLAGLSLRRG